MPNVTPNYSFNLPLVNNATDADLWGGYLNSNWSDLDTLLATFPSVSGNNTFTGNNTFSGTTTLTTASTTRELRLESTETDAGTNAVRERLRMFANNVAGTARELLLLDSYYSDSTNASEDSVVRLWNYLAGAQRAALTLGAGLVLSNATGGDKGDGTVNAKGVYENGELLGLGTNQTWTDVTASRALATNYTNSTGKPIVVSVRANAATTGTFLSILVDGVEMAWSNGQGSSSSTGAVQCIIPNGAVYRVNTSSGHTLTAWRELR